MVTRKKTAEDDKPKLSKTTAIANWDEELARQAAFFSKTEESTATGSFFKLKSGVLSFNDAPLPGNTMAVVILDAVLENTYYEGEYDSDSPSGPTCFAFGRVDSEMAPHKVVVEAGNQQCGASGLCAGCEKNEFGSADVGRGKACKNIRRLALLPAGQFENGRFKPFTDPDHFASAGIGFLKIPVTSVKGYSAFIKQVTGVLKKPPVAIFTKITVVPDASSQFKVVFEALTEVPRALLPAIMPRIEEARNTIEAPYQPFDPDAQAAKTKAPAKRGAKAQPPAKKYARK